MTDDPNDLDGLFEQRAGEDGPPDPVDHPGSEVLSAYSAHALPPEEELRVQEHLAVCRRCRDLLLDFASFLETPLAERTEGVTDLAAAAEWRALRERMDEEGSREKKRTRRPARRLSYVMAVAAILMAVVGFYLYTLSKGPESLKTLEPLDSRRGLPAAVETVQLPVTLLLKSPAKSAYPEYRADLLDEAGHRVREFSHLRESRSFDLEIPLGHGELDPGEYRIELSGLKGGIPSAAGKYAFKVVEP